MAGQADRSTAATVGETRKESVMLVLSRKKSEAIVIEHPSGNIRVVVTEIRGDKVLLGIEADRSVTVHRQEVYDKIERQKEQLCPQ
jgi:carbon storage regulator